MAPTSVVLSLLALAIVLAVALRQKKQGTPLPPGPPADPLIGHARVFPMVDREAAFKNWREQYGDILHFNVLGQSLLILNKYEDAVNLLEKRGAIYSNRPELTTVKLMGYGNMSSVIPYGPHWRSHKRLLQEKLLAKSCVAYQDVQRQQARLLLQRLPGLHGDCSPIIELYSASSSIELVYGHRIMSAEDPYFKMGKDAIHAVEAVSLGTSLVDIFPFLQHMPHWLPGISALTATPRKWRPAVDKMFNYPFEVVLQQMKSGEARRCYVTEYVEHFEHEGELDRATLNNIRDTALNFFIGGFDTTWSTLVTFIYAMLLFPAAQRRAQEEIDRVVGSDRLPDFDDRSQLPYLDCVLEEVLRWNPILPFGVPHRSMQDDIYNGMLIPKDTLVMPNAIGMNRDDSVYRDPHTFYPERFLPKPEGYGENHLVTAFGFGRRICPGRHLADATVWIAAVRILATLDIANAIDEDGRKIVPEVVFEGSIVTHPKAFNCIMTPRSAKFAALVAGDE